MADETITRQGSERYARALATGEQLRPSGRVGPYTRHFAVINRAGEAVAGETVACGLDGSCC
ncbi:MAG: hypothetical protein M3436_05255 [Pseudomonadota bacterium]|nr:hypothetical protein [Pseudomonadota bacterium]